VEGQIKDQTEYRSEVVGIIIDIYLLLKHNYIFLPLFYNRKLLIFYMK